MSSKKPNKPSLVSKVSAAPALLAAARTLHSLPKTFPAAVAASPPPSNARDRILHAAFLLLNDEGFGALTQTRVAEKAGVRQSHLTYYFPTRIDLLRETAVYGCNAMLGMMSTAIESGMLTLANFRDFLISDISDRRIARLMCALIVASDEDQSIKPWLESFENANRDRLQQCFFRLGLDVAREDVELFHAAYVGAVILDLGEANDASLTRSQRIVQTAFDRIAARTKKAASSKQVVARSEKVAALSKKVAARSKKDATSTAKPGKTGI